MSHKLLQRSVSSRHTNTRLHAHKLNNVKTLNRPIHRSSMNRYTRTNAIDNDIVSVSYTVGKYITLFTFFYTSLNYFLYKKIREDNEDNEE